MVSELRIIWKRTRTNACLLLGSLAVIQSPFMSIHGGGTARRSTGVLGAPALGGTSTALRGLRGYSGKLRLQQAQQQAAVVRANAMAKENREALARLVLRTAY